MVSYERILWSHTRGYYGLIREDTMVSYERILWSHMRGYYDLIKVRNGEEKMPDPYPATNIRSIRYDIMLRK
ncbi:hypothetical protein CS548_07505 [Porphyromonas gingivalis]|nr:hypothetical protein CS548_07505 [Porphyromonas gingivalis]